MPENIKQTKFVLIIAILITASLIIIMSQNIGARDLDSSLPRDTRTADEVLLEKDWITQIGPVEGVALGDIDNDGHLDMAVVSFNEKVRVFKNKNGTMEKTPLWVSSKKHYATCAAWGDMDGDDYLELAVGCAHYGNASYNQKRLNVVFKNFGGTLGDLPTWYSPDKRNTSDICWADIDDDNDLELIAGNFGDKAKNVIYENRDNTLRNEPWWTSSEEFWTESIACGDVDNDNDLDLIVGNNLGEPNQIYYNSGAALETSATWTSDDTTAVLDIAIGDLDGDNDLDIIAGTSDPSMVIAYYNLGTSFPNTYTWSISGDYECTSIDLGDVDSDGDLDLAIGCKNNWKRENNYLHLNVNSSLKTTHAWESNDESRTTQVVFGDMDLDGDLDLVAVNNGSIDSAWIYKNSVDKKPKIMDRLPNNHPYGSINTPNGVKSGVIELNFTLYDNEGDMVFGRFEYSLNNGTWKTAKQWTGPDWCDINNLTTLKSGKKYKFNWDTSTISIESNNVRFRILIFEKKHNICNYQYSAIIIKTLSFGLGTAPAIPTGLYVSSITIDSLTLGWLENPTSDFVVGYEIYMNDTNSTSEYNYYTKVGNVNSLDVTNLAENTSYYFKVLALDTVPFRSGLSKRVAARTYNNPPTIVPGSTPSKITIPEDGEDTSSLNLNDVYEDTTGDPLKFGYKATKNFTITISSGGDVTLKPVADWFGIETIQFKAEDGQEQYHAPTSESPVWFDQEVQVNGINDPPIIINELGTIDINEDQKNGTSMNLLKYFDDSADGDKLKFRIVGQNNLTAKIVMSNFLEIDQKLNWHGTEYLTIYASDDFEEVDGTLKVIVHPVNDPPEIVTSSFYWQPGKWINATIEVEDVDDDDILHISNNIQEVIPGLIANQNYNFNPATGEMSIKLTNRMSGTYKINVTANDGTLDVTKSITITIATSGDTEPDGGEEKEKFDFLTYLVIPIIVVIIIIISIYFSYSMLKKKQKIRFIKCPGCRQSVVQKGKGAFRCEQCGTEIDPQQIATTANRVPPPEPAQQQTTVTAYQSQAQTQKVSGGYYPKSVLSGSVLDESEPEPVPQTSSTETSKENIPMAIPIATPAQAQKKQQLKNEQQNQ